MKYNAITFKIKATNFTVGGLRRMNQGERDELLFKLVFAREHMGSIRNPGGELALGPIVPDNTVLGAMSDAELNNLANQANLGKSPSTYKADCEIFSRGEWVSVSLKSARGQPPSIINHTHRKGMMAVCDRIGANFLLLDNMVDLYHALRRAGTIREDVKNDDPNSPFRNQQNVLVPILAYFAGRGTARGDSPKPATLIGVINDPFDSSRGIDYFTVEDYVRGQWTNFVFSLRNHNYTSSPECLPWEVMHGGTVKPQLHVRI